MMDFIDVFTNIFFPAHVVYLHRTQRGGGGNRNDAFMICIKRAQEFQRFCGNVKVENMHLIMTVLLKNFTHGKSCLEHLN